MRTKLYTRLCLIILLFSVFTGQAKAQHVLDDRIDSLQKLIAKAPPDTAKVNLYQELISNYFIRYRFRDNRPSDSLAIFQTITACQLLSKKLNYAYGLGSCLLKEAKMYHSLKKLPIRNALLQQAFSIFNAANDRVGLAHAYICKADFLIRTEAYSKISLYDTAIQLARESRDLKLEGFALKNLADIHLQQGQYTLARKELLNALELQKRAGDNTIHYTTDLLAHVSTAIGNHKESLQYAIASIDYSRKTSDTIFIATFYQRLAYIYLHLRNFEKAYNYYGKAVSITSTSKNRRYITIINIANMCYCLMGQNKYKEAFDFFSNQLKTYPALDTLSQDMVDRIYLNLHYFLGHPKEAEKYLLKIFKRYTEHDFNSDVQMELLTRGGELYFELKQFNKAAWFSDSGYALARYHNSWLYLMENSLTLYKLDSVKGNYLSAIRHYQEYKNLSDSIQKDVAGKQATELAVQYETDQKNTELELLNNKARLQEEVIGQSRFLRNAMIAGSALLLILLLVIYSRYRLKQKANRLMEEKQKEKDRLLMEKEWLLKEVHHRVKNNLQIVMSLLNSQTAYIDNEPALTAIHDSQHRVHAMSLIHQKLYNAENVSTIDMSFYIRELTSYLADSYNTGQRIRFEYNVEPLELDVTQAVPLGLILNEVITNAIKYAFPDDKYGVIFISLTRIAPDQCLLCISDNGIGIPADYNNKKPGSLGMSLIEGLSEDLDGHFSIENNNGTTIKISFVHDLGVRRPDALTESLVSNN